MIKVLEKKELAHEYPECCHRKGDVCLYGSRRTGRICGVNPIFCKYKCLEIGGPCNNLECKEEPRDFFISAIKKSFPFFNSVFAKKIIKKYLSSYRLCVPENWNTIKSAVLEVTKEFDFCGDILVTGSMMIEGASTKDLDIVIEITDPIKFIENKSKLIPLLPRAINGVKTDIFFATDKHKSFFMLMNPDKKEVYTSNLFSPSIENEKEFVIIHDPSSFFVEGFSAIISIMYSNGIDGKDSSFLFDSADLINKLYGKEIIKQILEHEYEYGTHSEKFLDDIAKKYCTEYTKVTSDIKTARLKVVQNCFNCEHYHKCGNFCKLLTRNTDLISWLKAGNLCPIDSEMCNDSRLVSVLIPVAADEKKQNYTRTIDSVLKTAQGPVEILFLADGWCPDHTFPKEVRIISVSKNIGERRIVNKGFLEAKGEFCFRIDAHCSVTNKWDTELKKICNNSIAVCSIDSLNEETWERQGHSYTFVKITPYALEKWWGNYSKNDDNFSVQETLSLTGCGWMVNRELFLQNLMFDEDLSSWGCIGPELTAKCERSNIKIMLHKRVFCGHVFNTNKVGYSIQERTVTQKKLLSRYCEFLYRAAKRFDTPDWEMVGEDYLKDWTKYFKYDCSISKAEVLETKNKEGSVISKILKVYHPVDYIGKEDPDIPRVKNSILKTAKIKEIKISKIENGEWRTRTIKSKLNAI